MTTSLDTLAPCFQGLLPATLYTCSKAGIPNCAMLSHVEYVDSRHVALSFQFFNKSRRNITENPRALVRVYDPDTLQCYELDLRYERSEDSGPLFDSMSLRIEAIASHSGLKGIFKLIAADVYEVLAVEKAVDEIGILRPAAGESDRATAAGDARFTMTTLREFSERIHRAVSLEGLLDSILESLENLCGFRNSMILLAGGPGGRLVTIASRGYPENGVGSEVGFGEGIIGMVAEARRPIRIAGLVRQLLYAYVVGQQAREHGLCSENRRIPLPGLAHPESQLGIPLLASGELVGVLCVESETPYRFHEEDKVYVEVLGSYLAIAIQNTLLRERSEDGSEEAQPPVPASRRRTPELDASPRRLEVAFYRSDECILVEGEYLIRSLPAKILWKLLHEHELHGRSEFTNRELRLDKSLALPAYKDNLESRLILLRRRLEQRCPDIRITPCSRGRFLLELGAALELCEKP